MFQILSAHTIMRWGWGVDLADQFNSYYENGHRSWVKYYLRVFFDLTNTCIVKSGIVFNKIQENHQLPIIQSLEFRRTIVRKLIGAYNGRIYATSTSPIKRRKSNEALTSRIDVTHLPETPNLRKRCKLCKISKIDNRTYFFVLHLPRWIPPIKTQLSEKK